MVKMKTYTLSIFKNFKCINSKCKDNCCISWQVDIDCESLSYYKGLNTHFSKKILDNVISDGDGACFKMDNEKRCPFLNSDNLCDIMINLGEDKVPYICQNHPRFYNFLYDRCECGYGISCEVASKLLLSDKEIDTNIEFELTDNLSDILSYSRKKAFEIIKDKTHTLSYKVANFLEFSLLTDDALFMGDYDKIILLADSFKSDIRLGEEKPTKEDVLNFVLILKKLEPLTNIWQDKLNDIIENIDEIYKCVDEFKTFIKEKSYYYDNLFVYLVFRYYLKSLDDSDILSKSKFILTSLLVNVIMDIHSYIINGNINREENQRLYSKEIEYNDANVDYIYQMAQEDDFSCDNLLKLTDYFFDF